MLADVIRHLSNELHGEADRRQSRRHVSKRLAVLLLSLWIAIGFTHTVKRFAGEIKKGKHAGAHFRELIHRHGCCANVSGNLISG